MEGEQEVDEALVLCSWEAGIKRDAYSVSERRLCSQLNRTTVAHSNWIHGRSPDHRQFPNLQTIWNDLQSLMLLALYDMETDEHAFSDDSSSISAQTLSLANLRKLMLSPCLGLYKVTTLCAIHQYLEKMAQRRVIYSPDSPRFFSPEDVGQQSTPSQVPSPQPNPVIRGRRHPSYTPDSPRFFSPEDQGQQSGHSQVPSPQPTPAHRGRRARTYTPGSPEFVSPEPGAPEKGNSRGPTKSKKSGGPPKSLLACLWSWNNARGFAGPGLRINDRNASDSKVHSLSQCHSCRDGGFLGVCGRCNATAFCFSRGAIKGCIPESAFDNFICPPCYKEAGESPPYPVPPRAISRSHLGSDTSRLILYSIYWNETQHSRSAATFLEGQLSGLFYGKESECLMLQCPFTDLAAVRKILKKNLAAMRQFMKFGPTRLVVLLQAHADPTHGDLIYADKRATNLQTFIKEAFKDLSFKDHTAFPNSLLFLNACGTFIQSNPGALESAVEMFGFQTLIAFSGRSVDVMLTTKTTVYDMIDFHVVGREPVLKALERSAGTALLSNTSVVCWTAGEMYLLVGASFRDQPNGIILACPHCSDLLKYVAMDDKNTLGVYRCWGTSHPSGHDRAFEVEILQPNSTRKIGGDLGRQGRCRYIIYTLPRPYQIHLKPNIQAVQPAPKVWALKRKQRDRDADQEAAAQMAARMEKFRNYVESNPPIPPTDHDNEATAMRHRLDNFKLLLASKPSSNF
ncbi:hypothetical protein Hypma_009872 [Hypsizygus marmoreus]|uniref:Uncharacterized protein n=1 Tax=Hypsizygus marmoreus TaxID=39966 RepID=A0A369JNZ1_HYPMA|nr:hypothetical protein Hypma_009872 [Hypsizygus marmoreus]